MGQRHMTYIYVRDEEGNETIGALYNQWNHASMQAPKVVRFEKQLAKWKRNKVRYPSQYDKWVKMYTALATISDYSFDNEFHDELSYYSENYGMYDEDNNDGWQFIIIELDSKNDRKPPKVTHGFKPEASGKFMNLFDNIMQDDRRCSPEAQLGHISKYVEEFSKTEQKLLHKINDSFDLKKLQHAELRLKYLITQAGQKNSSK